MSLRYDWPIADTPAFCGCGGDNSIDHILTCKRGGYVGMRHNALRNIEGALMRNICRDVKIEPPLIPIQNENVCSNADGTRLDICAI